MKSLIIQTAPGIAGGSEIRLQETHGGAIQITQTDRYLGTAQRMASENERVTGVIPLAMRAEVAALIAGGSK